MAAKQAFENKELPARRALLEVTKERPIILDRSPVLHKMGVISLWAKLIKGDSVKLNPYVHAALGSDVDGDTINFQVPTSKEAVRDAVELMLPSKNLFSALDNKSPQHMMNEYYVAGLFEATRANKKKGRVRTFATIDDVKRAYREGEIGIKDEVQVLK
jgi:DNA-directed RNA polymerase subunit beta'